MKDKVVMQGMPAIWNDDMFWVHRKQVIGELASWAVRQSPYPVPDALRIALMEFSQEFPIKDEFFEIGCEILRERVLDTFKRCPAIQLWNQPKKGNHEMVFVSRYDQPHPDHDCIDLHALARNIAHSITIEQKFSKLHDVGEAPPTPPQP